jgi:hypothetical protein
MTNHQLLALLKVNMGLPLTPELAADICLAADRLATLIPAENIQRIEPEQHGDLAFSVERIEGITDEIEPLHRAHWDETEEHRHELPFNPDLRDIHPLRACRALRAFHAEKRNAITG